MSVFSRTAVALAVAAILLTSCHENSAGPGIQLTGSFVLQPNFATAAASFVPLGSARLTLSAEGESQLVIDTVITIAPADTAIDLSLSVVMLSASDRFVLNIYLITPAGDTAFHAGPTLVTPSTGSGEVPIVDVHLEYVGIGFNAAGVRILTPDSSAYTGDTILFVAEAFDSSSATIPGTPIKWVSLDPTRATVPIDTLGRVVAGSGRGPARITATLPTGRADTAIVTVQPVPAQIVVISGAGQSAVIGSALPAPVVLEVRAADALPVTGVSVRLTAAEGAVSPDSVGVDGNGQLSFSWTLGATVGTQAVTATVVEFPAALGTVSATATSLPGYNSWTGTAGDGLWTTAGNWSLNRVPVVTDTAVIGLPQTVSLNTTADVQRVEITNAAAVLTISSAGAAALTVADGFENAGSVNLISGFTAASAALTVNGGTFLNTGTVSANSGFANTSQTLTATVDNQGTLQALNNLTVQNAGRTFSSTAGTLATTGAGRTLRISGGTVRFGSGTVFTGSGIVQLPAGTLLELTSDFTLPAGDYALDLAGGSGLTVNGPGSFIVADTLQLARDTINAPFTAQHRVLVADSSWVNDALSIPVGGLVRLNSAGATALTVANGFTNAGTIEIEPGFTAATAGFSVLSGTLLNTGTISAISGFANTSQTLTATVDNQGTLQALNDLTVQNAGRTFSSTAGTLATTGAGRTLRINGGTVRFGSGTVLTGSGFVQLPAGTLLELPSDFTLAAGDYALDLAGGNGMTVNGPGAFIVADTLALARDTINAPLTAQHRVLVGDSSWVNGALSIPAGGLVRLNSAGATALTVANGFTNAGTIEIEPGFTAATAGFTVLAGTLVNTGTISVTTGFANTVQALTVPVLQHEGTLSVATGFPISGQFAVPAAAAAIVTGNGSVVSVTGLDVDGLTLDNVPLVSSGGTIVRFDNVTFDNMSVDAVQLTVNHPGAATPFTFDGVQFLTTPSAGRFFRANDTNTGDGNALTIDMANSTPADGTTFEDEQNGAVINWGTASPGVNVWTATSGVWSNDANWSLSRAPIAGDTVQITQGGDYVVTLDRSPTIAKLTIGGGTDIITLRVADGSLTITDAGIDPGLEILLLGRLELSAATISAGRVRNEGDVYATGFSSTLLASAITNLGTWRAFAGDMTITHGTTYDFQNSGIVRVESGHTLTLGANGALTYQAGQIEGQGTILVTPDVGLILGADLTYDSLTIELQDGFMTPLATERLTVGPDATLILNSSVGVVLNNDVENQGTMIALGEQNFPQGSLYNAPSGLLQLDGTAGSVALIVAQALDNAGSIEFVNTAGGLPATLIVFAGNLTNQVDATIFSLPGDGTGLHTIDAQLINDGIIALQHDLRLTKASAQHVNSSSGVFNVVGGTFELVQTGTDPTFTNDGTFYVGGGDVIVTQDAANSRVISNGALVVEVDHTMTFGGTSTSGTADLNGGAVLVSGTLTAPDSLFGRAETVIYGYGVIDVSNFVGGEMSSIVAPGNFVQAGRLTFVGDLLQSSSSTFVLDLGGPTQGASDLLEIQGEAGLAGTLDLNILLGYTPAAGDRIPIMTFSTTAGLFSDVVFPTYTGLTFDTVTVQNVDPMLDTLYLRVIGPPQPVVFAGDSAGGLSSGVFTVDGDGTNQTRLLNFIPTGDQHPRWAPDFTKIVFTYPISGPGTENALLVVSSDGLDSATVAADTSFRRPRYSRNGTHLAFECGDGGYPYSGQDVCVIGNAPSSVSAMRGVGNGTGKTWVTDAISVNLNGSGAFTWNPLNDNQLAVVRDTQAFVGGPLTSQIWLVNYDGTGATALTTPIQIRPNEAVLIYSMDWAPGGSFIAFEGVNQFIGEHAIFRVELSDGTVTQLTTPGPGGFPADYRPVVSPNSSEILFAREVDGWVLMVMPSTGSASPPWITDVFNFLLSQGGWDWSPDGSEIVHTSSSFPGGGVSIGRILRTTTQATYITDLVLVGRNAPLGVVWDRQPSWRP